MSGVAKALEQGQVDERTSVAAPEDGRTPFGCGFAALCLSVFIRG